MVYLQKRDFEKNGFKYFRHFRTRNLTLTPKRLDVLYEVVAYLVKLCIKVVGTFKKTLHDSEMLNLLDRPLLYWRSYLR